MVGIILKFTYRGVFAVLAITATREASFLDSFGAATVPGMGVMNVLTILMSVYMKNAIMDRLTRLALMPMQTITKWDARETRQTTHGYVFAETEIDAMKAAPAMDSCLAPANELRLEHEWNLRHTTGGLQFGKIHFET